MRPAGQTLDDHRPWQRAEVRVRARPFDLPPTLCRVASQKRHEPRRAPQRVQGELSQQVELEMEMTRSREPLENREGSITLAGFGVHPRQVDRLMMARVQRVSVGDGADGQ